MKTKLVIIICSLFAALCVIAGTIALSPIGELSPVGAEASTNLVLSINRERFHGLCVTFAFEATSTNGVEIAVGADADGDERLSVWESDWTFGFDCGRWIGTDAEGFQMENVEWKMKNGGSGGVVTNILHSPFFILHLKTNVVWSVVRGPGRIAETRFANGNWYAFVEPTATNGEVEIEARFNNDGIQPSFVLPIVEPRVIPVKAFVVEPPIWTGQAAWADDEIHSQRLCMDLQYKESKCPRDGRILSARERRLGR